MSTQQAMAIAFALVLSAPAANAADEAPFDPGIDIYVLPTHVEYKGDTFQCLLGLANEFWNVERTQAIDVHALGEGLADEALKVVAMLENLGFADVKAAIPPTVPASAHGRLHRELKTCGPHKA